GQGGRRGGMAVPQAGDGGAARRIEVALAGRVDDFHAAAAGGHGQRSANLAMQDVGHALSRELRRGRCTPKAESCASACSSAASALLPPRPATSDARISATASKGVMVWKKEGLSVATRIAAAAMRASGETSESVSATTGTPRPAA